MKKDIKNREARLRRAAAKKGLYIKKRKWRRYYSQYDYDEYDGYGIGTNEIGVLLWGEDENGMNSPSLEEAELIVLNY